MMEELNPAANYACSGSPCGADHLSQMLLHFDVGRQASIQALDESMASGQPIFLVAQKELGR